MRQKAKLNVIFWGPIGIPGKTVTGGGESGNKRTINMLKQNGIPVDVVPKPYPPSKKKWNSPLVYTIRLLISTFRFSFLGLSKKRNNTIAHVSSFYGKLVYFDLLFLISAKILQIPFVYEIRGGAMLKVYQKRSRFYRLIFLAILKNSDAVFIQGQEYEHFVTTNGGKIPVYYPNYVDSSLLDCTDPRDERSVARKPVLIYFGRIVHDKGIEIILDIFSELSVKGISYQLKMIGQISKNYKSFLRKKCIALGIESQVHMYGPMPFAQISDHLKAAHYFIFPTFNKMEGHSNSLTEAMAFGVVPVCSDQGFNQTVVNGCGKIFSSGARARDYEKYIKTTWEQGMWEKLSKDCKKRICENYTSRSVIPRIINCYEGLTEKCTNK